MSIIITYKKDRDKKNKKIRKSSPKMMSNKNNKLGLILIKKRKIFVK